jgi:LacI family transcriptional regulator
MQLVSRFGVSRPTVSRALRDLETRGLIERRAGSGTYVSSNQQRLNSTRVLGLLLPGLSSTEIFHIICGEIASLARVHEYGLLWGGSTNPRQDADASLLHAEEVCKQFIERKVSGVFFAPAELQIEQEVANFRIANSLREAGIPVVLLDRDLTHFPMRSDFDLVGIDNVAGGYMIANHLIKLGCQRILFVFREALVRNHLETDSHWVREGDPSDVKFVRSLISGHLVDAIICANDDTAAVLIHSMELQGMRPPHDVRVVGFDDVKYATLVSVPLTTIHQPCRDIAVVAFQTMLRRLAEPTVPVQSINLTPHLVVRESCGAYLSQKKAAAKTPAPGTASKT